MGSDLMAGDDVYPDDPYLALVELTRRLVKSRPNLANRALMTELADALEHTVEFIRSAPAPRF
jgi:hypothetical protein